MSESINDKKLDLIAQMLAKAESTTPEEAEALTEAAEKLMIKYAIDQSVIDARRAKKGEASEKIVEERLNFTGAYRGELIHLSWMVANGLGNLRAMQSTGGNNGKVFSIWIIGFESDVAQAKILIESLQIQAAVAVREWWKTNKVIYENESAYVQEKSRRSFVHGFGTGAGQRIRSNRNQAVEEVSTGTALVLVSRKAQVDAHMDEKSLRKGRARTATGYDGAAGHGYAAGQHANTGEKSVGHTKGVSA